MQIIIFDISRSCSGEADIVCLLRNRTCGSLKREVAMNALQRRAVAPNLKAIKICQFDAVERNMACTYCYGQGQVALEISMMWYNR